MRDAVLVRARQLSPSVRELTFDPGPDHHFVPGHWVTFFIDDIKRQYSLASAPREDGTFDLAVTRVTDGPMSTFLHDAEIGTKVRMLPAQGLFVLEPMTRPILMVATGTGVAPFRAMIQEVAKKAPDHPSITLLFGNRTEADILYRDELTGIHNVDFVPVLSRGDESWTGRRGWVQHHLPSIVQTLGTDIDVYICGLTKMVKEVRRMCREELGIDRKRVHIERYD
jgi:CDP-4-dehydro-6-deoxyglucose reductase, E3